MSTVTFMIHDHQYVLTGSWIDQDNENMRLWCDAVMSEITHMFMAGISFQPPASLPEGFLTGQWFLDGVSPAHAVAKFVAAAIAQEKAEPPDPVFDCGVPTFKGIPITGIKHSLGRF